MLDGLMLAPAQKSLLAEATTRYHETVGQAASYLMGRGLGKAEADSYLLGCVVDPLPGHERFQGMLSIAYLSPVGPLAIKFRRIDESSGPKYDSPAGQHPRLYNAQSLAPGGELAVVCEGELDAVMAQSRLGIAAVASPGTTWLEHWGRCFGDWDRVLVIADHDAKEDGSDPGLAHARKVVKAIPDAQLVLPPAGLDMSDWLNQDEKAVRKALGI